MEAGPACPHHTIGARASCATRDDSPSRPIRGRAFLPRSDRAAVSVQELRRKQSVVRFPEELDCRRAVVGEACRAEAQLEIVRVEHAREPCAYVAGLLGLE